MDAEVEKEAGKWACARKCNHEGAREEGASNRERKGVRARDLQPRTPGGMQVRGSPVSDDFLHRPSLRTGSRSIQQCTPRYRSLNNTHVGIFEHATEQCENPLSGTQQNRNRKVGGRANRGQVTDLCVDKTRAITIYLPYGLTCQRQRLILFQLVCVCVCSFACLVSQIH